MNIHLRYQHEGWPREVIVGVSVRRTDQTYYYLGQGRRENGDLYVAPNRSDILQAWRYLAQCHLNNDTEDHDIMSWTEASIHDKSRPLHNVGRSTAHSIWAEYPDGVARLGRSHMRSFDAEGSCPQLNSLFKYLSNREDPIPVSVWITDDDGETNEFPPFQWGGEKKFCIRDLVK